MLSSLGGRVKAVIVLWACGSLLFTLAVQLSCLIAPNVSLRCENVSICACDPGGQQLTQHCGNDRCQPSGGNRTMNNEDSVWVIAISLTFAIRHSDFKTSSRHALTSKKSCIKISGKYRVNFYYLSTSANKSVEIN